MEQPKSQDTIQLKVAILYTIYVAGFNHGANEGAFPNTGTFDAFQRLMIGESPLQDRVCYGFQNEITFVKPALSHAEIEKLGMESLKGKWAHLFIGDNYPKPPYPTSFKSDLDTWMLGYYTNMGGSKIMKTK